MPQCFTFRPLNKGLKPTIHDNHPSLECSGDSRDRNIESVSRSSKGMFNFSFIIVIINSSKGVNSCDLRLTKGTIRWKTIFRMSNEGNPV